MTFFLNSLSLFSPPLQFTLTPISPLPSPVEGSHGNDGLLLGRPLEEPDQPITEKSLLEILDGVVMMYNLSVHQQLGKVHVQESRIQCFSHTKVLRVSGSYMGDRDNTQGLRSRLCYWHLMMLVLTVLPLCHSNRFVSRHTSIASEFDIVYMRFRRNYLIIQYTSLLIGRMSRKLSKNV